jgi:hypothetical protein
MRHSDTTSCPQYSRISGRPPFRQKKRPNRFLTLFSISLLFLLIVTFLNNIPPVVPVAHAQTVVDTATGTVNLDRFNAMGNPNTSVSHGAFVRPSQIPASLLRRPKQPKRLKQPHKSPYPARNRPR